MKRMLLVLAMGLVSMQNMLAISGWAVWIKNNTGSDITVKVIDRGSTSRILKQESEKISSFSTKQINIPAGFEKDNISIYVADSGNEIYTLKERAIASKVGVKGKVLVFNDDFEWQENMSELPGHRSGQ